MSAPSMAAPMRLHWTALLLAAALLPGCSDGDGDKDDDGDGTTTASGSVSLSGSLTGTGTSTGTTTSSTMTTTTAPRDPVTWGVTLSGNAFDPRELTVQVGDTVAWTHDDGATPHTVTAQDGSFDSGSCPGPDCMTGVVNSEFEHTFDTAGSFTYVCEVHATMTGSVEVLESFAGTP